MKAHSIALSLLILLLTSALPVLAQPVPLPGPARANIRTAGVQERPVIAAGPTGDFVVVWVSAGAEGPALAGQLFGAGGGRAGGELRIAGHLAGDAVPGLAVSRDSSFTVVWRSADENLEGRRYDHRGEPLTGVFQVADGDELPRRPSLAATIGGEVVAVWEVGPGSGVVGQRLAADGRRLGPSFPVHSRRGRHARPVIAAGDDGRFVVAWQGDDGSGYGVFGRRFDRRGAPLDDELQRPLGGRGGESQLNVHTADDQQRPALAVGPDGGFAVVWESALQDGTARSIVGRRFDCRGRSAGGEVAIQRRAGIQRRPALALNTDGTALVAWEDLGSDPRGDVVAQWIGRDGRRLGPELELGAGAGAQLTPHLAATGRGAFAAAWTTAGAGGESEIGLRRYASPRLELLDGRFVVEVDWKDFALRSGRAVAVPHRANTGHFWFFRPEDLDLTVKVVDGRTMNGHFWLYYGAVSNVAFTLRIHDRVTGRSKTYLGPVGGTSFDAIRTPVERLLDGRVAEMFVGQELLAGGGDDPGELHFWVSESSRANAEIDFLLPGREHPLPIEVKSGASGALKSLHQFLWRSGLELGLRLYSGPYADQRHRVKMPDGELRYRLLSLPLYLAGHVRLVSPRRRVIAQHLGHGSDAHLGELFRLPGIEAVAFASQFVLFAPAHLSQRITDHLAARRLELGGHRIGEAEQVSGQRDRDFLGGGLRHVKAPRSRRHRFTTRRTSTLAYRRAFSSCAGWLGRRLTAETIDEGVRQVAGAGFSPTDDDTTTPLTLADNICTLYA